MHRLCTHDPPMLAPAVEVRFWTFAFNVSSGWPLHSRLLLHAAPPAGPSIVIKLLGRGKARNNKHVKSVSTGWCAMVHSSTLRRRDVGGARGVRTASAKPALTTDASPMQAGVSVACRPAFRGLIACGTSAVEHRKGGAVRASRTDPTLSTDAAATETVALRPSAVQSLGAGGTTALKRGEG
eukprot:3023471-Prymnesium_polylepis.5